MKKMDKTFLGITLVLLFGGLLIFFSASLGILAKSQSQFYSVLLSQLVLGLVFGLIALYAFSKIPYKFWRKHSLYIFLAAIGITALVFVPHIGFSHGGARRWIALGPVSFQPVEFLKLGFVIYLAAWLSWLRNKSMNMKIGIIPFAILLALVAGILLKQPDTKSLIIMGSAGIVMLFVSGLNWKWIVGFIGVGVALVLVLAIFRPYVASRIKTYINPSSDITGSSYQLNQSLIAIGSGGIFGRGYGQSVQKFNYLPEPQGDSIFAIVGEELGFIGGSILILIFIILGVRGLKIANHAPDQFSRLLGVGVMMVIMTQSFLNIASIVGLFPLTGVPLVFVSQGGTSLAVALGMVGIMLQISKHQNNKVA